jgi:hypothetical protein
MGMTGGKQGIPPVGAAGSQKATKDNISEMARAKAR